MNFKVSSKKYHYLTKQGVRNKKAERWTRQFVEFERNDRNRYARMPSPKGENWEDYIKHRLRIMKKAIAVYTSKKYTHLRFDKYIESNRTCDKIAALLVSICNLFIVGNNLLRYVHVYVCVNRRTGSRASFSWELRISRRIRR